MSDEPEQLPGFRILVDHHGNKGLGDVVCETALYPALRRKYPDSKISSRNCRTIAWGNPHIDGFDDSSPDSAYDRVFRFPNLKQFDFTLRDSLAESRTIFEHVFRQARFDETGAVPELYVLPREMNEIGLEDDGGDGLIIALSADSKEFDRRWGAERFKALAEYFESRHGASVIELGSGFSEGHLGVGLDLVGKTTLRQVMAILSLSDLLVGNHGGLTHLAGGVGTPILSPWGASHPYWAYRYDAESRVVEPDLPCQNCRWTGASLPQCVTGDRFARTPCTQLISIEQMIAEADILIPDLREKREILRKRKERLRNLAKDPIMSTKFEIQEVATPFSHDHFMMGGLPSSWAHENSVDNFARLDKMVAFPDFISGADRWKDLVANFVSHADAGSDWVLMLHASALTSVEVCRLVQDFINNDLILVRSVPKIVIMIGAMTAAQQIDLINRARVYVSLGGSRDLPLGSWTGNPAYIEAGRVSVAWRELLG